jgi:hypothetical protein
MTSSTGKSWSALIGGQHFFSIASCQDQLYQSFASRGPFKLISFGSFYTKSTKLVEIRVADLLTREGVGASEQPQCRT